MIHLALLHAGPLGLYIYKGMNGKQIYQDVHVIYPFRPNHLKLLLNSSQRIMYTYLIHFATELKMPLLILQVHIIHHVLISQDAASSSVWLHF